MLATADGVAHLAFFTLFSWRVVAGSGFRIVQGVFAFLALLGFGGGALGALLIKHGGKTKAGKMGLWLVASSTGLAGVLLVLANLTGD